MMGFSKIAQKSEKFALETFFIFIRKVFSRIADIYYLVKTSV